MRFDPSAARKRVDRLWSLQADFGMERGAFHCYLNEVVSDRYVLLNGLQLLRDELQFAGTRDQTRSDISACGADLSLPSVVTTLAHTNCGDRIHQGEATKTYVDAVAARFATMSETGEYKLEAFSPTGGGTDDGATLAHVTVAHQLDEHLRKLIYKGNAQSYVLVNIDLKTHVGRLDTLEVEVHPGARSSTRRFGRESRVTFGRTQESPWREPRAACGAIMGTLFAFNPENAVHRRVRADLGEANHEFLSRNPVLADDGTDVTAAVAAAIVAIQGMQNTARALGKEMDERGLGHVTASVTVNRPSMNDTIIYLARGTVFHGEVSLQGLGTDARRYSATMVDHPGDRRLRLIYDGQDGARLPVVAERYEVMKSVHATEYD